MGAKDTITKKYMGQNVVFADAFNYFLYDGETVIKPEDLTEKDITGIALPFGEDEKVVPVQKFRDVYKSWLVKKTDKAFYLLLGIENQTEVHYAMAVRSMLYDALNYSEQVVNIASEHRETDKREKVTDGEFLSGFYSTDKLMPIISLVIYFGADKWECARSIHEMLEIEDEAMLKYIPNYKLNLIVPEEIEDFEKFGTDLRVILEFMKNSKDKKKLKELLDNQKEVYYNVDKDTVDVLRILANIRLPINAEEGDAVDMCKAFEDMKLEGIEEGIKASIEMCRELGISQEMTLAKLIEKFQLKQEEADEYLKKYW